MQRFHNEILTMPLGDIPQSLMKAQAGSAANKEMLQILAIRSVMESTKAVSDGTKGIENSTTLLAKEIDNIAKASAATSSQVIELNKSLSRATWAIAILTAMLAVVGAIQLFV